MAINDKKIGGVSPNEVPKKYPISKLCMIMGILSLCILPIFSLPGIVTGLIAHTKEREAKKYYTPGLVTSIISFTLFIIVAILIRLLLSWVGLDMSDFSSIENIKNINSDGIYEKIVEPIIYWWWSISG